MKANTKKQPAICATVLLNLRTDELQASSKGILGSNFHNVEIAKRVRANPMNGMSKVSTHRLRGHGLKLRGRNGSGCRMNHLGRQALAGKQFPGSIEIDEDVVRDDGQPTWIEMFTNQRQILIKPLAPIYSPATP